jgi:hypothetical protein
VLYIIENDNSIVVRVCYNHYLFEEKAMSPWDYLNRHHFNTPKGALIFGIVFGFLFGMAVLQVALIFYYGFRLDRCLLKYHFEYWKQLKDSREARRNFKYPDDPQINKLQMEEKKVRKIVEFIWLIAFLCAITIALLM